MGDELSEEWTVVKDESRKDEHVPTKKLTKMF